jgi:hypothetical protein
LPIEKISGLKSQVITLNAISWTVEEKIKLKLIQYSDFLGIKRPGISCQAFFSVVGVAGLLKASLLVITVRGWLKREKA